MRENELHGERESVVFYHLNVRKRLGLMYMSEREGREGWMWLVRFIDFCFVGQGSAGKGERHSAMDGVAQRDEIVRRHLLDEMS